MADQMHHRDGLPVAPSMDLALETVAAPAGYSPIGKRTAIVSAISVLIGIAAAFVAEGFLHLIDLATNLFYHGRISLAPAAPSTGDLGLWGGLVPVLGALIIGLMARYGSAAIRGHGIPEVMEKILHDRSRIGPRIIFLKPLSAAVAIGTGGPFGAEGPIIATGGALGSLVGQIIRVTADERKTLLAAGAAAGMAATFGSPVAAVLLAIELLLFEYRPRSIIPVAFSAVAATAVRIALVGSAPMFPMPDLLQPTGWALAGYLLLGGVVGVISVYVSRLVYAIEDAFERLPIHWMWWPALGALVVGVVGLIEPRTLGVGYDNIAGILSGTMAGQALLVFIILKLVSWSIYLGSGTSGGTLAPLFTIGGGLGALLGGVLALMAPGLGIDVRIAALVGMAAIFAGASHALLASIVFAFEITRQPLGLLPLLGGCSAAYMISLLMTRNSIMTEKLARRGTQVRTEYSVDYLSQVQVRDAATREVIWLDAARPLGDIRSWLAGRTREASHQGFPVLDPGGHLLGVVTMRDLLDPAQPDDRILRDIIKRPPVVVYADNTLREAADLMVRAGVGRLAVVAREEPGRLAGIISRSDLLAAHAGRLEAAHMPEPGIPERMAIRW